MKKSVPVLIGLLLMVSLIVVISTLLTTNPLVTDDGHYSAKISGRTTLLEFTDSNILYIHTNPGKETYKYTIDNDKITLTDIYTTEVSTHSFQYLKDERIVVFDNVRYTFCPKEG